MKKEKKTTPKKKDHSFLVCMVLMFGAIAFSAIVWGIGVSDRVDALTNKLNDRMHEENLLNACPAQIDARVSVIERRLEIAHSKERRNFVVINGRIY